MPTDPSSFGDFASYPYDGIKTKKGLLRTFNTGIIARIGYLPDSFAAYPNQIIVARSDGGGLSPAGSSGNTLADFAGVTPVGMGLLKVPITASSPLTATLHRGRILGCNSGSEIVLGVTQDASPDAGVQDGFSCMVLREAAGAVRVSITSPLTNGNPAGDLRVQQGFPAFIWVDGTTVRFWGYTAP